MTAKNVNRFLIKSEETNKGHQQQQRMHQKIPVTSPVQQTTVQPPLPLPEEPMEPLIQRTHVIFAAMYQIPPDKSDLAYGDLTGRYPFQSLHGYNYVLVVYHYDANGILVKGLKNCEKGTILNSYKTIHGRLKRCGRKPKLQVLNNLVCK